MAASWSDIIAALSNPSYRSCGPAAHASDSAPPVWLWQFIVNVWSNNAKSSQAGGIACTSKIFLLIDEKSPSSQEAPAATSEANKKKPSSGCQLLCSKSATLLKCLW